MTKKCSQCHSESYATLFVNHDYISGQSFDIVKCDQCQLLRTLISQNIALADHYPQEYYGKNNRRFHPWMEAAIRFFRKRRQVLIQKLHPEPGKILDVGCGRGLMLDLLRKNGWEVQGIEHSAEAAIYAQNHLKLPVRIVEQLGDCHFADEQFDVVTLWHVFEHLSDPAATLQEIDRILKPGGVAVIEFPNQSSWQSKISKGAWFHLDAPRHLYHFDKETLMRMAGENRLTLLQSSTCSLEFGPYGMMQSILNRLLGRQNVLYTLLKNGSARNPENQKRFFRDIFIHLLLLGPVVLLSFSLEWLASLIGKGGIIQLVLKKPGNPNGLKKVKKP